MKLGGTVSLVNSKTICPPCTRRQRSARPINRVLGSFGYFQPYSDQKVAQLASNGAFDKMPVLMGQDRSVLKKIRQSRVGLGELGVCCLLSLI